MNPQERAAIEGRTLLLFDGLCSLCNGTIRFLIRRDPDRNILYAPLESSLGQEMLESAARARNSPSQGADGVVLIQSALTPAQTVTTRSDAAIRVLALLRTPWPLVGRLLAIIPRPLREYAYGCIARSRYKLFGTYKVCPLPTPSDRGRILSGGD